MGLRVDDSVGMSVMVVGVYILVGVLVLVGFAIVEAAVSMDELSGEGTTADNVFV